MNKISSIVNNSISLLKEKISSPDVRSNETGSVTPLRMGSLPKEFENNMTFKEQEAIKYSQERNEREYKYIVDETAEEGYSDEINPETILQKNLFIDYKGVSSTPSPPIPFLSGQNGDKEPDDQENESDDDYISKHKKKDKELLREFTSGKNIDVFMCLYSINTSCYIENVYLDNENDLTNVPFIYPYEMKKRQKPSSNLKSFHKSDLLGNWNLPGDFLSKKHSLNMNFPFVEYLLLNNTFPSFRFKKEDFSESTNVNIEFETECIKQFNDIIKNIHDLNIKKITEFYKGIYILTDEDIYSTERSADNLSALRSNLPVIYAFFDVTNIPKYMIDSKYIWGTIDEIVYKKNILGLETEEETFQLFKKENQFRTIYSLEDRSFPFPFQLYLCKNTNTSSSSQNISSFFFSSNSSSNNETTNPLSLSNVLIGEPIEPYEHPVLGYGYYFTSEPLANTSDINKLQRFSCFIVSCYYMVNIGSQTGSPSLNSGEFASSEENKEVMENILAASSIYFIENGVQYWFIKNISHFTKIT